MEYLEYLEYPKKRVARWLDDSVLPSSDASSSISTSAGGSSSRGSEGGGGDLLHRLLNATPSRIAVGRSGTRYKTPTYLKMRADHAIAKDAVYSEVTNELIDRFQLLPLKTLCSDRENYLLYPDRGRRLEQQSVERISSLAIKNVDVQIIVGDGLSAWAITENLPELFPCLQRELKAAAFSLGHNLFVKFARVGVQDHVGTLINAKSTLILVGERPGLGTGDSLSIYIAFAPKLDQDNAEKNCISNIRKLGLSALEAAEESVRILRNAFSIGRGGVAV